jgi:hypothetical protein
MTTDPTQGAQTPTPEEQAIRDRTPYGELDVEKVSLADARAWFEGDFRSRRMIGYDERHARAVMRHLDRLEREENEHAELQARCFEGFPSVSDGIFDAFKECRASHAALLAQRDALAVVLQAARQKLEVYRAQTNGEYSGGPEYTSLMRAIDAALAQQGAK